MPRPRAKNSNAYIYAVYFILSLSVYSRAFDNPFRQDDFVYLRHVETTTLRDTFKPSQVFAFYRPGAKALFSIEHKLFARNSGMYIMFNYTLHCAISILMLLILLRIDLHSKMAFLASGLFLVGFGHYAKQVMWACTSGCLASVLLSLASILITLQWLKSRMRGDGNPGRFKCVLYPIITLILLTVSPLFHEVSLVTVIVIAFIVMVFLQGSNMSKLNHVAFFFLPLLLWLAFWFLISKTHPAYGWTEETILNAPVYLIRYLGFMVLPVKPTVIIASSPMRNLVIGICQYLHIVIGSTMFVFLLYLAIRSRSSPRVLSVWLLIALAPFTFVQMPKSMLEVRYLYYASIPFCGLTAIAVHALWRQRRVYWKSVAVAVIIGVTAGSMVLQLVLEKFYDRYTQTTGFIVRPTKVTPAQDDPTENFPASKFLYPINLKHTILCNKIN